MKAGLVALGVTAPIVIVAAVVYWPLAAAVAGVMLIAFVAERIAARRS